HFLPTYSPKTSALGSSFMAVRRPSLIAWSRVRVAMDLKRWSERELAVAGVGVAAASAEVEELLALLADVRGDLGVHVREDRLEAGRADLFGRARGGGDFVLDLLAQRGGLLGVEQPGGLEVLLEARQGVALLPVVHLLGGHVALRVVGGRVAAHAERARLDQRRPVALARALDGLERRLAHREEVVAVHDYAGDAVGLALDRETVGGGLLLDRARDRPAV